LPRTWNIQSEALFNDEQQTWTDHEQEKRMAVEPILKLRRVRATAVLFYRQNPHITMPAVREITTCCMVSRMAATPEPIRSEREKPTECTQHVVCAATAKERSMSAIVLDDE
jgi:hypothetical protein